MYFEKVVKGGDVKKLEGVSAMGKCSDYCPDRVYGNPGGCCNGHGYVSYMVIWID